MKDEKKAHGIVVYKSFNSFVNRQRLPLLSEKIWSHNTNTAGSYCKLACWQLDEIVQIIYQISIKVSTVFSKDAARGVARPNLMVGHTIF